MRAHLTFAACISLSDVLILMVSKRPTQATDHEILISHSYRQSICYIDPTMVNPLNFILVVLILTRVPLLVDDRDCNYVTLVSSSM